MITQHTPEQLLCLDSGQVMMVLDECRTGIKSILGELTTAICNYKTLERMLPHKLAVIKKKYLDFDYSASEARDYAMSTKEYLNELNKLNAAYDDKKELELLYEVLLTNMKAITSLAYLKNSELRTSER